MDFTFLKGKYSRIQPNEEYKASFTELYNILGDGKYWNQTFIYDEKYAILEQFHYMIGLATELYGIPSFRQQWNDFIIKHGKELFIAVNKLLFISIAKKNGMDPSNTVRDLVLYIPDIKTISEYQDGNYNELLSKTIDYHSKKRGGDVILPATRNLVKVWKEYVWTDFKTPRITGDDSGLVKPPVEYYNMLFDPKLLESVESHNTSIVKQIATQIEALKHNIKIGNEDEVQKIRNNIAAINATQDIININNYVIDQCCSGLSGNSEIYSMYPNLMADVFMYYYFPNIGKDYDSSEENAKPFEISNLTSFLNSFHWMKTQFITASLDINTESPEKVFSDNYYYDELVEFDLRYIINYFDIIEPEDDSDEYDSEEYVSEEQDLSWMDLTFLTDIKNRLMMPHPPNEIVERDVGEISNLKVFDVITLEKTPVEEYLRDNMQKVVIFIEKNDGSLDVHGGFKKNQLKTIIDENDFFYECPFENDNLGVTLNQINSNNTLVQIKGVAGNLYVNVFDLSKLLKTSWRTFLIQPDDREAIFTTGIGSINVGRGVNYKGESILEAVVSADHCQANSNKKIYTLLPLELIGLELNNNENDNDVNYGDDAMSMSDNDVLNNAFINDSDDDDSNSINNNDSYDDSIERVSGNIDDDWLRQVVQDVDEQDQIGGGNRKKRKRKKCYCKKCAFKRMVL